MREKLIEILKYCASPEADCTKCDRWKLGTDSKCVVDLLLSAAIALEEKQATSDESKRWIPVTERLPAEEERVLVWLDASGISYTQIDTDRLHKKEWCRWGKFVTHWMPLPDPPKEERRTDA